MAELLLLDCGRVNERKQSIAIEGQRCLAHSRCLFFSVLFFFLFSHSLAERTVPSADDDQPWRTFPSPLIDEHISILSSPSCIGSDERVNDRRAEASSLPAHRRRRDGRNANAAESPSVWQRQQPVAPSEVNESRFKINHRTSLTRASITDRCMFVQQHAHDAMRLARAWLRPLAAARRLISPGLSISRRTSIVTSIYRSPTVAFTVRASSSTSTGASSSGCVRAHKSGQLLLHVFVKPGAKQSAITGSCKQTNTSFHFSRICQCFICSHSRSHHLLLLLFFCLLVFRAVR